jgi:hypothetical protein
MSWRANIGAFFIWAAFTDLAWRLNVRIFDALAIGGMVAAGAFLIFAEIRRKL